MIKKFRQLFVITVFKNKLKFYRLFKIKALDTIIVRNLNKTTYTRLRTTNSNPDWGKRVILWEILSKMCRRIFLIIIISSCLLIPLLILCALVTCWEFSNSHTCMENQKQELLSFIWLSKLSQYYYWEADIELYVVSTVQCEHFWLIVTKCLEDQRKCGTLATFLL